MCTHNFACAIICANYDLSSVEIVFLTLEFVQLINIGIVIVFKDITSASVFDPVTFFLF